jgi:hypothetical protein
MPRWGRAQDRQSVHWQRVLTPHKQTSGLDQVALAEEVAHYLEVSKQQGMAGNGNVTSNVSDSSMDATQCNSYRPITVLPVTSSLQLSSCLNKAFTPHDHQIAFGLEHSRNNPLLALTAPEKAALA